MAEIHYLISDASKKVDVEAHVLRYWEEELELRIPRNDMGHRYYTDFHIRLFKQVKMLKEKGYQLKAIKSALEKSLESDGKVMIPNEVLEKDVIAALRETELEELELEDLEPDGQDSMDEEKEQREKMPEDGEIFEEDPEEETFLEEGQASDGELAKEEPQEDTKLTKLAETGAEAIFSGEKLEQFQKIMNHIIGRAMEENCEKLSQDVSCLVHEKFMKEMDYFMRVADEKEEERFKRLDDLIRIYQREVQSRAETAVAWTKLPFFSFKKKKFGRNGNKI